jgi:hypothetical protein
MRGKGRETPREYLDRESHYLWGKRYLLQIVEKHSAPGIELKHNKMILRIRPATNHQTKQVILEAWYRENLRIGFIDTGYSNDSFVFRP